LCWGYYSLYHSGSNVWLNDLYDVVVRIWNYLIEATPQQIDGLPELKTGQRLSDYPLSQNEKELLGFSMGVGGLTPRDKCSSMAGNRNRVKQLKQRYNKYGAKIKNWSITLVSYEQLPNLEATWFIDPPYQKGGKAYQENKIDYSHLAGWCKSRRGQVIVCENDGGDWLPFRPLPVVAYGSKGRQVETVWTNGQEGPRVGTCGA
jgi:hypothetical protein